VTDKFSRSKGQVVAVSSDVASPSSGEARLKQPFVTIARLIWLVVAGFSIVVFVLGVSLNYADLGKACTVQPCDQDPTPASIAQFHASGLTLAFYSGYIGTIELISALLYLVIGLLIFARKSDTWIGLLTSLFLITYGVAQFDGDDVLKAYPALAGPTNFLLPLGFICLGVFLYVFPDGHFVPRWTRFLLLAWVPFFFITSNLIPGGGFVPLLFAFLLISLGAQVYRYRRVSTPLQRQQTKWVVFGVIISIVGFVGIIVTTNLVKLAGHPGTFGYMWGDTAVIVVQTCLPLSIGIAILRSRLFDIDVIINQTLVYGSLTALLGGLYAGLIVSLESLAQLVGGKSSQGPVVLVTSTLAIAALFQPVRHRVQSLIDRRFYRRKYDAGKTLDAFSATLRQEVDLQQLCEEVLQVVRETMQPEQASLWIRPPRREPGKDELTVR
jgi:hypothetical protein